MNMNAKRGMRPSDRHELLEDEGRLKVKKAADDVRDIIERGYGLEHTVKFVGDHYQLSMRQRLAIIRTITLPENAERRKAKNVKTIEGKTIHIDGFNTIIPLEIAYSGSILLRCDDGTIRDLGSLHGTYRMIPETEKAIKALINTLNLCGVKRAVVHLDKPVSNSGRLKTRLFELSEGIRNFELEVLVEDRVDSNLKKEDLIATGDAIILDECNQWFNLISKTINDNIGPYPYLTF